MSIKTMVAKYESTCTRCWETIYEGMTIEYDSEARTATHPDCQPAPRPEPTGDLALAVEYLRGLDAPGELEASFLEQYRRKGQLSPKQLAVVLDAIATRDYPGPEVVPAGGYAIPVDNPDIPHILLKVWRAPGNPRIVRTYVLLKGEQHQVPAKEILAKLIQVGPKEAAKLYGNRTGKCSICDQPLKNALSRRLRMGPVCLERFHSDPLFASFERDEARQWLRDHGIDPKADLPLDFDLEAA